MDIKNIIIVLALILMALMIGYQRGRNWRRALLAFIIAIGWTSYYFYEYQAGNIYILNSINIYPLVLWTCGLFLLGEVYSHTRAQNHIVVTMILYWVLLILVEAVGYYALNIRLTSNYTSLLNLGVIHAPLVMKLFYLAAGPTFLLLLEYGGKHLLGEKRARFARA